MRRKDGRLWVVISEAFGFWFPGFFVVDTAEMDCME